MMINYAIKRLWSFNTKSISVFCKNHSINCCVVKYFERYTVVPFNFISFLSFPTVEIAKEFLECFKDLIEQAGDLI